MEGTGDVPTDEFGYLGKSRPKRMPPYRRPFASDITLMTYASLRVSVVRRIRTFGSDGDSIRGALLRRRKKAALPVPASGVPARGALWKPGWVVRPLPDLRDGLRIQIGQVPTFAFPLLDRARKLVSPDASPHSNARRNIALMLGGLGCKDGGPYTLHPPKNSPPRPPAGRDLINGGRLLSAISPRPLVCMKGATGPSARNNSNLPAPDPGLPGKFRGYVGRPLPGSPPLAPFDPSGPKARRSPAPTMDIPLLAGRLLGDPLFIAPN